jgi:hypothetical protein
LGYLLRRSEFAWYEEAQASCTAALKVGLLAKAEPYTGVRQGEATIEGTDLVEER